MKMRPLLSSWKEIAQHFGKGVRTVQRWERTLNMPVHRPANAPYGSVLARTADLEQWMSGACAAQAENLEEAELHPSAMAGKLSELEPVVQHLADWVGIAAEPLPTSLAPEERVAALAALMKHTLAALYLRDQSFRTR